MPKSKYETHVLPHLDKIFKWVEAGATEKEIADKLGISYSSFRKYLKEGMEGSEKYSALSAPFARACVIPDDEVEAALYKRAVGQTVEVKKHFKLKRVVFDKRTGRRIKEEEYLEEATEQEYIPADTRAQIFWLTNRRPDRWKNKPEGGEEKDDNYTGVAMLPAVADEDQDEQPETADPEEAEAQP